MMITVNLNVCFPWIASWNEVSMPHLFCNHIGCFWNMGTLLSSLSELCSRGCSGLLGQTPPGGANRSAAKPASRLGQALSGHALCIPSCPPSFPAPVSWRPFPSASCSTPSLSHPAQMKYITFFWSVVTDYFIHIHFLYKHCVLFVAWSCVWVAQKKIFLIFFNIQNCFPIQ